MVKFEEIIIAPYYFVHVHFKFHDCWMLRQYCFTFLVANMTRQHCSDRA